MSYKIIRVLNGVVSIASSDGTFFNVPIEELDFDPKVGDDVQCFRNGEKVIVFKKGAPTCKQKQTPNPMPMNEPPSNLQAGVETSKISKTEPQRIECKTPTENLFVEEAENQNSRTRWVIAGVILVVVAAIVFLIHGSAASSAESSMNSSVCNATAQTSENLHSSIVDARTVVKGTMTDSRDGKIYKTVKIGNQEWMAENLNYNTQESQCYKGNSVYCSKYGRLYTWNAAMTACPSGWHLPSKSELKTLMNVVGGQLIAGRMLKSRTEWLEKKNGLDVFSFTVLPAGYGTGLGNKANFRGGGSDTFFWSSTEYDHKVFYVAFSGYDSAQKGGNSSKDAVFSVRCIKN